MNLLRSLDPRVREQAALHLRDRQRTNLKTLHKLLNEAPDEHMRGLYTTRILATNNHIAGWTDYISQGCPLEPRAQVRPEHYPLVPKGGF